MNQPKWNVLSATRSRRSLLKGVIASGASLPLAASLLAACGGDDDEVVDEPTTDAEPSGSTATSDTAGGDGQTATTTSGSPSPDQTPAEAAGEPQAGGVLRYSMVRDPIGLDPHIDFGATGSSLQGNVYDKLVDYDEEGNIIPALATSWDNPDDVTWVMHLREDVVFHSGDPLTGEDVVYTIQRILAEDTNAAMRSTLLDALESFEALDDYTVQLVTKQPLASLLAILATVETSIVSKAWSEAGGDYGKDMNGTGPFKFEAYEPEVKTSLVKHTEYWQQGMPYFEAVELLATEDINARVNALKSGQANYADYIPWQEFQSITDNPALTLYQGRGPFNMVRLHVHKAPLDNVLVRQALNYAVNREEMIQVAFGGFGEPMDGALMPKGSFWYQEELDDYYTYDPDKAKALLAEAGYSEPSQVKLTFKSLPAPGVHGDTALVVLQNLQDLGIDITFETIGDIPTLNENRLTGDFQMMMDGAGYALTDPDALSGYYAPGGPDYAAGVDYANPEVTELLTKGRTTLDRDERKAIYRQAEELIIADAPLIFLFWRPQAEASVAELKGYTRVPALATKSTAYFERMWLDQA